MPPLKSEVTLLGPWTFGKFQEEFGISRDMLYRLIGEPITSKDRRSNWSGKAWIKKNKNEKSYKIIKEEQLYPITVYTILSNHSKFNPINWCEAYEEDIKEGCKKLGKRFEENFDQTHNILKKARIMEESGDKESLSVILKSLKNKSHPLGNFSFKGKIYNKKWQKKLNKIVSLIEKNKNNFAEKYPEIEKKLTEIDGFFERNDLNVLKTEFALEGISYQHPIDLTSNKNLFAFLDSSTGQDLRHFRLSVEQLLDILEKYSVVDNIKEIGHELRCFFQCLKFDLKIPYFGYGDMFDGYNLPQRIFMLGQKENYDNYVSDLEYVLKHSDIDLNRKNKYRETLLQSALIKKDLKTVRLLFKYGVTIKKDDFFTLLKTDSSDETINMGINAIPEINSSFF